MPALSQSQIQSLPDIIATDRFTINFGVIPTFGDTSSSLLLKCLDVVIPGIANERFTVPLATANRNFRGRRQYEGGQNTFGVTFVESVDLSTLEALRQWMEYIVGTNSGNSQGYLSSYSVNAVLNTYDTTGSVADTVTFYNCFPLDFTDVQLSTQQTNSMNIQASFSYDYCIFANTTVT